MTLSIRPLWSLCSLVLIGLLVTGCWNKKVEKKSLYTIAYPINWREIQLYGTEQSVIGFSSDLMFEIAKQVDIKIQLVPARVDEFPSLLESGAIDAILTAMPVTTISERFYEFSIPYFITGSVVIVGAQSRHTTSTELKNAEIGFDRTDGSEIIVGTKTTWVLRPYDSYAMGIEDVIKGKIDGMVMNYINASRISQSLYRSKIKILLPPLVIQNVRLAVRRGKNQALIQLFDEGVRKYVRSGSYKGLLKYWGIESPLPLPQDTKEL